MNDLTEKSETPAWFKAVLLFGMLVFAFYASTHMVAAGDTWVAMACGRHFDNHGVDTVEPFSFNSHRAGPSDETLAELGFPKWTHGMIRKIHPTGWINQNWLTHLGYYKLTTWFGGEGAYDYNFNTLVYWKFGLYFLTVLLVFALGKVIGVPNLLAAAAACLAMVIGRSFYDIRPAGYSNMLTPAFVLVLALAMCRNHRWIWWIVPLVVFWANVHGGYIYAFIILVPFIGINLLLRLPRRWSLCLGFIGLWLVLYLMSYKFISGYKSLLDQFYLQVQAAYNLTDAATAANIESMAQRVFGYNPDTVSLVFHKMLIVWLILAVISVVLTSLKQTKSGLFYFYHIFAGAVFVLSLLPRFFVSTPSTLPAYFSAFVTSSMLTFLFLCFVLTLLILAMAIKKDAFTFLSTRGIYHVIGASAAAFLAMIVFNPFHLTNLTHTFEISVSKHAESWRQVNEWKPAFDFMDKTTTEPNPVGDEEWFGVLCVLTLLIFTVWLVSWFLKPRPHPKKVKAPPADPADTYAWPKINLALLFISFFTIYLAIRSRRFIAISGTVACPIAALMLWQAWQMIRVKIQFHRTGQAVNWSVPAVGLRIIRGTVTLLFIAAAVFWGLKYKRVYLDPWPTDATYDSVFMRMTASHLKPIEACEFIRLNGLSGRVFNYWTEGGAVALGQDPDPETGEIPLKLFMDGRAQAAYNHDTFKLWQTVFSGGAGGQKASQAFRGMQDLAETGRRNTPKYQELEKVYTENIVSAGTWISQQLAERDVWVVLMPITQEHSTFVKALKTTDSWKTAYLDDIQHMLVNVQTSKGEALIAAIRDGKALFPTAYAQSLTTFHVITENRITDRYADLYRLAKEAFDLNPAPASAMLLTQLRGAPKTQEDLAAFLTDFLEHQDAYQQEAGYFQRLNTARICADFLADQSTGEAKQYRTLAKTFKQELEAVELSKRW
jgi:hypothetical protein